MPSKRPPQRIRSLTCDEQRFIRHYVQEGGIDEKVAVAERKAKLKAGTGAKMLTHAQVIDEVNRRMAPVWDERRRQQLLADAVNQVTAGLQGQILQAERARAEAQAELDVLTKIPKMKVASDEIEHQLMRLVTGLDQDKHPQVKLAAIQVAFVVAGLLDHGTLKRAIPIEPDDGKPAAGVYQNLFERLRSERANAEIGATPLLPAGGATEAMPLSDDVFDLVPRPKAQPTAPASLSAFGEPVDARAPLGPDYKAPKGKSGNPKVMTVEVG
jgi:hypothetical protein